MTNENLDRDAQAKRGRPWLAIIPLLVFAALAAIFFKQLTGGSTGHDVPSALIGKPAPQFELPRLEGLASNGTILEGFSTASLQGKVSVVNVWASWCAPCRVEHPEITKLAQRDDIQLLGLNYKDKTENALRFLGQLGNPFDAVGVDSSGSVAIDWGVYGVPETFIVNRAGIITYKHVGPLSEESMAAKFLPELEKALSQSQ
ncbi:MAG: DsbE family thiol:disulfide interchange protein [Rhizobiaceae bacterium]